MRRACSLGLILALATSASLGAQVPAKLMGATYHDASRAFIDLMVPHHEMAIMMSEHHAAMSHSDAVKALATRMIAGQRQEIAELRAARQALFGSDSTRAPVMRDMMQMMMRMEHAPDSAAHPPMRDSMGMRRPPMGGMPRAGMPAGMPGMAGMMSGDPDRMYLVHMIAHHQEGIDMSILAEDSQAAARVKQLAKRMREAQERDITEMRRILASMPAHPAGAEH